VILVSAGVQIDRQLVDGGLVVAWKIRNHLPRFGKSARVLRQSAVSREFGQCPECRPAERTRAFRNFIDNFTEIGILLRARTCADRGTAARLRSNDSFSFWYKEHIRPTARVENLTTPAFCFLENSRFGDVMRRSLLLALDL
jgi:hypothetical protein